jgi:hypothetical protein
MHRLYSFLIVIFMSLLLNNHVTAQVNVGLTIVGTKLTVTYYPQQDYLGASANAWSRQRITIKYRQPTYPVFTNFTNLSAFQFVDVGTVCLGNGFCYKTFEAQNGTLNSYQFLDLTAGQPMDVFSFDLDVYYSADFEILTGPVSLFTNQVDVEGPMILNYNTNTNQFGTNVIIGSQILYRNGIGPLRSICGSPFNMVLYCYSPITGLDISDFDLSNAVINSITYTGDNTYNIELIPTSAGFVDITLRPGTVTHADGNTNALSAFGGTYYHGLCPKSCLAEYYLQELNDGYYQVSLISNTDWSGTDAITATGQVTLKVGTSVGQYDKFNITDLTMLIPGVQWAQNSRYDAPAENPAQDYISFGLTSYGTNQIPYVAGDTVPLFRFKNTGICSGDSVYLMPTSGDAFAWPNSINANVGQQLSVSGHNEPDVPLCVSGVAPCLAEVAFDFKVLLQGAYVSADGLMHDKLRQQSLVPTTEPYTNYQPVRASAYLPFVHQNDGGGENVIGINSAFNVQDQTQDNTVDWVMVELRSKADPKLVIATQAAMVERDGDIRGANSDRSFVVFRKLREDAYYFTVRHRNHLGLMTNWPMPLKNETNIFDFTRYPSNDNEELWGEVITVQAGNGRPGDPTPVYSAYPGIIVDGKRLMWAGNSNADNYIMFQGGGIGEGLDIDNVFDNIFSDPLNANYSYNHVRDGYYPGDNNLDGKVKYQGPANDVDPFIFFNIISRHPDNINKFINYYITEGIPRD